MASPLIHDTVVSFVVQVPSSHGPSPDDPSTASMVALTALRSCPSRTPATEPADTSSDPWGAAPVSGRDSTEPVVASSFGSLATGRGVLTLVEGGGESSAVATVADADPAGHHGAQAADQVVEVEAPPAYWMPPILRTVASRGEGIAELIAAVERHRAHLEESGELAVRRRGQLKLRVATILKDRVLAAAERHAGFESAIERGHADRIDPYALATELFAEVVEAERRRAGEDAG